MTPSLLRRLRLGFTRNVAFTSPRSEDPRLEGRTYAIPFDDVWQETMALVGGELKRWEVLESDDREGVIRGVARGWFRRFSSAFTVRISLDADAQTRVDAMSASHSARRDFGANARRVHRFFTALDERLEARRGADIGALRVEPLPTTVPIG